MYLGDYSCREDRNLGSLGATGDIPWQEVTYLPTSFQAGQDTGYSLPTYFDPSANTDWLAGIGFTSNPILGRHKIDVPDVMVGYGEQSSMGPGPLPDGWYWHPGGLSVSGGDPAWVEWTPVRQWEKDKGYRQQYYWGDGGNSRYARYVDSAGNQVGPVVQTYKESKFAKVLGKVVQLVAGTVVVVAGGAAIATVASGAAGAVGATGAAGGAAPGAAEAITAAAAAPAATTTAAEIATAAAVPAASAAIPAAGGAAAAVASALPTLATVAKTVAAVAPIAKTILSTKQRQDMANAAATPLPIAPPANMVPPPSGLMPSSGPTQFSPIPGASGAPSWLIPAAIGGGILALVMMNRRRQPTRRRV